MYVFKRGCIFLKRFFSAFLALAIIAAQLAFAFSALPQVSAASVNFKCGDNATWYLDEHGVLTISGTGDMYSFNDTVINEEPWYDFRYSIKSVVIEEGITSIGCGAFSSCYNAERLHIASTVERIEYDSLGHSGEKHFRYITVGENSMLRQIDDYALSDTLWYDNYPDDSPVYIGRLLYGFNGFPESGSTLDVREGTYAINVKALYSRGQIAQVNLPDSVEHVGQIAFSGTGWIKNHPVGPIYSGSVFIGYSGDIPVSEVDVVIKEGTKCIAGGALNGSDRIMSLTLPSSLKNIDDAAFYNCFNLESVTIPQNSELEYVGASAFSGCEKLSSFALPESVEEIGNYAFSSTKVKKINLGKNVERVGIRFIKGSDIVLTLDESNPYLYMDEHCVIYNESRSQLLFALMCTVPTEYTVDEGCRFIHAYAFEKTRIQKINFNEGLEYIDNYAFQSSNLTSVTLPDSFRRLGLSVFSSCPITEIDFGTGISVIPSFTFSSISTLKEVVFPSNITELESTSFRGCKNLEKAVIPATVTRCPAFEYCDALTIYCYSDSAAHNYAVSKNIPFVLLDGTVETTEITDMISQAESVDRSLYTSESLAELDAALNAVDLEKEGLTQNEINEWVAAIGEAIENLDYAPADFSQTDALLKQAGGIDRSLYTAESLENLDKAVAAVDKSVTKENQSKVAEWNANIENAIRNLEYAPADFTQTDTLLKQAGGIDRSLYTAESLENLDKAVAAVDKSVTKENQSKVAEWNTNIENAIRNLKYAPADFSVIDALITKANKLDRSLYTAESLAALDKAVAAVDKTVTKENQSKVAGWVVAIDSALNNLKYAPADFTAVDTAVKKAQGINRNLYTAESLAALDKAVAAVDKNVTKEKQSQVNSWASSINSAINNLKYKPADYTQVNKAVAAANKIDLRLYSDYTVTVLKNALKSVNYNLKINEQKKVDGYASSINAAIAGLQYASVTLRHDVCGVIVSATAKEIDPDTSLAVEKVDSSEHEGTNFAVGGSIKSLNFYDINLVLGGKTVQPSGTVTVKIKLASGVDPKKCKVYHVTDDKVNPLVRFASTIDGNYIAFETTHFSEFAVIEVETVVDSVEILSLPSKTEYTVGETFETKGLTVAAHYSDGTSKAVTDFNVGMVDLSTQGEKTVTVYYTFGSVTKSADFKIKVVEKTDGKPVTPPEEKPEPSVSAEITAEGKPAESYAKKLGIFNLYSRASILLGASLENADGCTLRWSSDNSKVFVDENGKVTCKGLFGAKKAKITLEVIDPEGNIRATDSVQVIFYKLSFQLSGFAAQTVRIMKQTLFAE